MGGKVRSGVRLRPWLEWACHQGGAQRWEHGAGRMAGKSHPSRKRTLLLLSSAVYPKWRNPYRSRPHTAFFDYSQTWLW